jgi:hypothetical protein
MAILDFIPSIWTGGLLANLHKNQVFAQPGVVNRDYEGEIANKGDSVRITAIGKVTVSNYVRNADMSAPEALTDAQMVLVVDQAKSFNFAVDDVDAAQAAGNVMPTALNEAAYALSDVQDILISGLYTQVAIANQVATSGSPKTDLGTAGQPYVWLTKLKLALDVANVPQEGRWVVIPPWYEALLLLDDRFAKSFVSEVATGVIRNGNVGRTVLGFNVLRSNNVVNYGSTNYAIMAGYGGAITMAEQIVKVEAYRPPLRFADAVKGLLIYGAKVVRPNGIAVLYAQAA